MIRGVPLLIVATIVFVTLNLAGTIDWPWVVVLLPTIIPAVVALALLGLICLIALIAYLARDR